MLRTDKNSTPFAILDFKERSQKEYIMSQINVNSWITGIYCEISSDVLSTFAWSAETDSFPKKIRSDISNS